jgi:hypothetical protein
MDSALSLLPADLPVSVKYFIFAMVLLNVSAVFIWGICLFRETSAPKQGRVRVRKDE